MREGFRTQQVQNFFGLGCTPAESPPSQSGESQGIAPRLFCTWHSHVCEPCLAVRERPLAALHGLPDPSVGRSWRARATWVTTGSTSAWPASRAGTSSAAAPAPPQCTSSVLATVSLGCLKVGLGARVGLDPSQVPVPDCPRAPLSASSPACPSLLATAADEAEGPGTREWKCWACARVSNDFQHPATKVSPSRPGAGPHRQQHAYRQPEDTGSSLGPGAALRTPSCVAPPPTAPALHPRPTLHPRPAAPAPPSAPPSFPTPLQLRVAVGDAVLVASDDVCEVYYAGKATKVTASRVTVAYTHYKVLLGGGTAGRVLQGGYRCARCRRTVAAVSR